MPYRKLNRRYFSRLSFGPDLSAVPANDPFDNRKSYSFTLELRIGMEPPKREKHFVRVGRIETGPVVLDTVTGFPVFFNGPELGGEKSQFGK